MQPTGQHDAPARDTAPVSTLRRVRLPLVLLTAFLVELIAIAAIDNQAVVDHFARRYDRQSPLVRGAYNSVFDFAWRFSPAGGSDTRHALLANLLLDATVLVVSLVLITTVVRGPITFFRAFFGVWMAVLVATLAGAVVRAFVVTPVPGQRRVTSGFFGPASVSAPDFWAGVGLGLLVALVTAIVAVATRRTLRAADPVPAAEPPPAEEPAYSPPPWQDQYASSPGYPPSAPPAPAPAPEPAPEPAPASEPAPAPAPDPAPAPAPSPEPDPGAGDAGAHTTVLPAWQSDDAGSTTELPVVEPAARPGPASAAPEGSTMQFPRPPDDEDAPDPHSD